MAEPKLNIEIGATTDKLNKALDEVLQEVGKFNAAIDKGDKDSFKNLAASIGRIQKDIKGLNPQIDALLNKLRDQTLKLSVETDTKNIDKLKADIANTKRLLEGLKGVPPTVSASFDQVKKSSSGASQGVLGFSRVLSDLPFGIVGVANNLEQLPQAFAAIKKTAQESGKSITSTLLTALTGPAGLGLALSAVTAGLTFASVGFDAWTRGFGKGKDEVDKYKERLDELGKSLKTINEIEIASAAQTEGQIANVKSLTKIISDSNLPYYQRKQALEQLKSVNKEFFGDLNLESATFDELTKRVNSYNNSLLFSSRIKGATDSLVNLSEQQRLQTSKTLKDLQEQFKDFKIELPSVALNLPENDQIALFKRKIESKLNEELKSTGEINYNLNLGPGSVQTGTESVKKEYKRRLKQLGDLLANDKSIQNGLEQQINSTNNYIQQQQNSLTAIKIPNPTFDKPGTLNKIDESLNEIKKKYAEFKIEIPSPLLQLPKKEQVEALKTYLEANLSLRDYIAKQKQTAREEAYTLGEDAFKEFERGVEKAAAATTKNPFLAKIGVKPEYNIDFDNTTTLDDQIKGKFQTRITRAFQEIGKLQLKANIIPDFSGLSLGDQAAALENFTKKQKELFDQAKNTASVVTDMLTPAFNSFFQALITGSGSPFKAFGQALKQLLVQIAAAIVKALIFKAIMSALFPQSAAAGAGIGSIISQALGFGANVGGSAAGSISAAGARGLASPGGSQQLVTEVRGSSLAFILQRTSNTTNRLG